jgi:type II secretion system protein G
MIAFTFTSNIEMHWLAVLADSTAKGLLLLLIAAGATLLLRRSSAALRHMVWTLSVAGLILVPTLSIALPQFHVPLLPDWSSAWDLTQASPSTAPESPGENIEISPAPKTPTVVASADPGSTPEPLRVDLPQAEPSDSLAGAPAAATAGPQLHWSAWVLLAWLTGAIVLLLPLLAGTVMVWRQTRRAERIKSDSWTSLLGELCRQLGIRGRVVLLRSSWSNIPVACGIFRPAIILPVEADAWPADRRRVVLLHELAHIRRSDCLTQLLARLVRVIYWFNPLVWLAGRMLRIERERACDDLVLASGHKASEYANHLLEIVRSLHSVRCPSLAAVAMARKSQFEGRLLAILDPRRNRRAMTGAGVLIAAVLAVGIAIPLAVLNGANRKPTEAGLRTAHQARTDAKTKEFVGAWSGKATDKPKEGSSSDTMTVVIPERPASGKWQAVILGSFADDEKSQTVVLKLKNGKLKFRAKARDGDMTVWLGLDRSGRHRLIGEAKPAGDDPRGDGRDIELTLTSRLPIQPDVKSMEFVGSWGGKAIDKPKDGTSKDTMTVVIPERPARGKWQALILGSFAYDGRPQTVELKLDDGKLTFSATARDGDMAVRLSLDRSGKRLIGEAKPTTNDPILSSPQGDARDIELTLAPSMRMRTGEVDISSSSRGTIRRAAKSDPQDLVGAVLSAKAKFAEAEPLKIKLAWKTLNWRPAYEGSEHPGAWDKSGRGLGWEYWRVIVNGKEYRYRNSVLNPSPGLALSIDLRTSLIDGPSWRPGTYRVQYIARNLPVIRLKDGQGSKIVTSKTIASNEVLFKITAAKPGTADGPSTPPAVTEAGITSGVPLSKRQIAKADLAALSRALEMFAMHAGGYPSTNRGLDVLVRKPTGIQRWQGPYIRKVRNDPWGRPYAYRFTGMRNEGGFDLLSLGPDGKEGTTDDVPNRTQKPAKPAARPVGNGLGFRLMGNGLEFRIALSRSALSKAELASYMAWLKAGKIGFWWNRVAVIAGRMPEHVWMPVASELPNAAQLVTGDYKGRTYVLVSDKPGQTMLRGKGKNAWGLNKAQATKDHSSRPAISFELDNRGAAMFAALTKANIRNTLAILIDGKVVSAPVLMSSLGKRGIITGRFTEKEAKALAKALSSGS